VTHVVTTNSGGTHTGAGSAIGSSSGGSNTQSGSRSSRSGIGIGIGVEQNLAGLAQKLVAETGQKHAVEQVIANLPKQPINEIKEMKEKLMAAEQREQDKLAEVNDQAALLSQLERKATDLIDDRRNELAAVEAAVEDAFEQKDEMQDELKGLEAKLDIKLQTLEVELTQRKEKVEQVKAEVVAKVKEVKVVAKEKVAAVKEEVRSAAYKANVVKAERDALRLSLSVQETTQKKQVEQLQTLIEVAKAGNQDYSISNEESIKQTLNVSEQLNEQAHAEMQEMRAKIARLEANASSEIQNLEQKVKVVEAVLVGEVPAKRMRRRVKTKMKAAGVTGSMKMPSIDEESDEDAMSTGSRGDVGPFMSDGEGGDFGLDDDDDDDDEQFPRSGPKDGDLRHLKDKRAHIEQLRHELWQERKAHRELKDQIAGKETRQIRKAERLSRQIWTERQKKEEVTEQVIAVKTDLEKELENRRAEILRQEENLDALHSDLKYQEVVKRKKAEVKMDQQEVCQEATEDMTTKLYHALEMKRLSQMRMEDTKREMQRRHQHEVAGLEATLSELDEKMRCSETRSERSTSDWTCSESMAASSSSSGETMPMLSLPPMCKSDIEIQNDQMIRLLQEERRDILHQLERNETQWQSRMREMEEVYNADVTELKKEHKQRVQALQEKHATEKQAMLEKRANIMSESQLRDKHKGVATALPAAAVEGAPALPKWMEFVKCPQRDVVMKTGPARPTNCQTTCWQVLNSMPELIALFCHLKDLEIVRASRKAYKTWGSATLHGQSLLSLLHRRDEAAWMKRAIGSHQTLADLEQAPSRGDAVPGFLARDLGCLALRARSGSPFDTLVTTMHMPAEPKTGKGKAIIVVLQPMVEESRGRTLSLGTSQHGPGLSAMKSQRSARSVASEDVGPSDSVSRVAERRYI